MARPHAPASGEQHGRWRGDNVGWVGVHKRLVKARGSAREHACIDCGAQAREWSFDEQSGFSPDISRYSPRCHSCHKKYDRRRAA